MRLPRRPTRAAVAILAPLAWAAAPLRAAAPVPGPHGTVQRLEMSAPSLGKEKRTVRVYLPPSYFQPESATRRYPVLYMLHGWPGSDGNWINLGKAADNADSLIAAGRIPEVIMVFPNGNGPGLLGRSMYMNNFNGTWRMEDFIVKDLVAWTDANFRTRPEPRDRGIIGLSDGASAALDLAFRHPDVFGACGGHSGQYRLTKDLGSGGVLGPEPGASRLLDEHSPTLYVDKIAGRIRDMSIYFDIGLQDDTVDDNRTLHKKLEALGIPHTYREFSGSHTWGYWKTHLRDSLIAVTAKMR